MTRTRVGFSTSIPPTRATEPLGAAAIVLAVTACGTREPDRSTGGAATGYATSPSDVNLGRPPWSNTEVRTPLDSDRRGRTAGRDRDRQTAQSRREARDERDRAYMGGGMVGTPGGGSTNQVR